MIDWRGNHYDVGSTVLYPRASGRSVEMTEAEVVDIKVKLVDVVWNENQYDWDKRIGLPKFEGIQFKPETKNPGYGYRSYARNERTPEYEEWQSKCSAMRQENPRLTETTVREDFTVMLLPINSSRFHTGKIEKEASRERALERFDKGETTYASSRAEVEKWYKDQKPVRITIIENITAI